MSIKKQPVVVDDSIAIPLRNRLLKNAKHLQRWARRSNVSCYRVYDADLPEFSFSLDRYQSEIDPGREWLHLQEYQAPATIEAELAAHRIEVARQVVSEVFSLPPDRLFCKTRSRQRGAGQYQKQDNYISALFHKKLPLNNGVFICVPNFYMKELVPIS